MNPIFKRGTSPQHRLIVALTFSALLIFFDHQTSYFESLRGALQSLASPLQYLANTPKLLLTWSSENLVSRNQLMQENQQYQINELRLHEQIMQLDILTQENNRLRAILASPLRTKMRKVLAEILSVNSDPYTHQLVINRGTNDGVYEGQPVLDEHGIVGQVLHVGAISSRVILITDVTHGVPVRIQRNGIRLIALGNGHIDKLSHSHVPHSVDIQSGDLLVTSGLGGKYPPGYPVSRVTIITKDDSQPFAKVYSEPVAQIDRLRFLLLLWPEKSVAAKQVKTGRSANTNNNKQQKGKINASE